MRAADWFDEKGEFGPRGVPLRRQAEGSKVNGLEDHRDEPAPKEHAFKRVLWGQQSWQSRRQRYLAPGTQQMAKLSFGLAFSSSGVDRR